MITLKTLSLQDLKKIGSTNRSHGYKGQLHCLTDLSDTRILKKAQFLFIRINGLPVPFFIEEISVNGNEFYVKFEDVNDESSARKLTGKEIFAEKVKEKKKDDYLTWSDLVGFTAIDHQHGEIGELVEVVEYPMQFIGRCFSGGNEVLLPLNEETVTGIDEEGKIVHLELPDGLLDIYLNPDDNQESDEEEE